MARRHIRWLAVGAAVVLVAAVIWLTQRTSDIVEAYCSYGAVSRSQLNGCKDHVSEDDVRGRRTNAAEYATRQLGACLADAGPFCRGPRRPDVLNVLHVSKP